MKSPEISVLLRKKGFPHYSFFILFFVVKCSKPLPGSGRARDGYPQPFKGELLLEHGEMVHDATSGELEQYEGEDVV